jgi:hypothetical protein
MKNFKEGFIVFFFLLPFLRNREKNRNYLPTLFRGYLPDIRHFKKLKRGPLPPSGPSYTQGGGGGGGGGGSEARPWSPCDRSADQSSNTPHKNHNKLLSKCFYLYKTIDQKRHVGFSWIFWIAFFGVDGKGGGKSTKDPALSLFWPLTYL